MKYTNRFINLAKSISLIVLIAFCFVHNLSAQSDDTLKVLFVGNSYTYFWNLPQTVSAMAASQNKVILARKSTAGGAYLREHWEGKKGLKTRDLIADGNWDIVVLQNNSLSTLNNYDDFMEYGKKFIRLIKKEGAKPLLYITWAREYNPLMQKTITKVYKELASETNAAIAPVGPVWAQSRALRPDLELFDPDGSHPSPIGTYLIATVFYGVITGELTSSIPERITTFDKNGEKLYLSIMTKGNTDFIQQLVDEYLSAVNKNSDKPTGPLLDAAVSPDENE